MGHETIAYVYVEEDDVYLFQDIMGGSEPDTTSPESYGFSCSWLLDDEVTFIDFYTRYTEDTFKSLDELLK